MELHIIQDQNQWDSLVGEIGNCRGKLGMSLGDWLLLIVTYSEMLLL